MSTVFSYDQSADAMSRIRNSINAINEIFANCDKVAGQLQENLQTTGVSGNQNVSEAALNAYNSLKRHYEEFITLIANNEQNISLYSQNMEAAQSHTYRHRHSSTGPSYRCRCSLMAHIWPNRRPYCQTCHLPPKGHQQRKGHLRGADRHCSRKSNQRKRSRPLSPNLQG